MVSGARPDEMIINKTCNLQETEAFSLVGVMAWAIIQLRLPLT